MEIEVENPTVEQFLKLFEYRPVRSKASPTTGPPLDLIARHYGPARDAIPAMPATISAITLRNLPLPGTAAGDEQLADGRGRHGLLLRDGGLEPNPTQFQPLCLIVAGYCRLLIRAVRHWWMAGGGEIAAVDVRVILTHRGRATAVPIDHLVTDGPPQLRREIESQARRPSPAPTEN